MERYEDDASPGVSLESAFGASHPCIGHPLLSRERLVTIGSASQRRRRRQAAGQDGRQHLDRRSRRRPPRRSFIRYAADIAKVLDDGDNLRVIPMVTYGAVGNVSDLLHLHGVDIAITQSDVLEYYRTELATPRLAERVNYIAPLFHAEVHVCAKPEYKTLNDLSGKRVAFNTRGSAATSRPDRIPAPRNLGAAGLRQ